RMLARSVDGVDVIVGGHSHSYLGDSPAEKSPEGPYPVVEHSPNGGKVLVVTAKRAAQYLGELTVGFDREGRVVAWQGAARELGVDAPRDPEVSRLVARYAKPLKAYRARKAGVVEAAATLPDGLDACRLGECRTGLIMVDAFLEYARPFGAQVALVPGGCVRAALPQGQVTVGDLLQTMPFGNTLVVRELAGAELKQALEQGVAADAASRPALLQPAGLAYTVDTRQPAGNRVSRVMLVDDAGGESPLDPAKSYRVVFISYLARGGDGHTVLQASRTVPSAEETELVALGRYLKAHNPLTRMRTGRIRWVR
ncbi:MAG: 5'-nucleotidase C-terminal domain-containing protein, partial [Ottowia sp.]|nr:5'-nucleotidase C-terminal domain-containing protein [Ottowia sp.]